MKNQFILTPHYIDSYLAGLNQLVQPEWWINKPKLSDGKPQERLVYLYRSLRDLVASTVSAGKRPVSIAGDCLTTIGVMAGLQTAGLSPTLIWFDAHGDFNTWETTPSGFLGGMPLAMMVGLGEQTIVKGVGLIILDEAQVFLSDARDLDPGEKASLSGSYVTHLRDVLGLVDFELPGGPIYIHFDTDVIDPADAPAMNYPTPGGPTAKTLNKVFKLLANSDRIAAISVSSWNPELDKDGQTEAVVMQLIETLIG